MVKDAQFPAPRSVFCSPPVSTCIGLIAFVIVTVATPLTVLAQAELDLKDYPKLKAKALPDPFRKWMEEEVRWILTDGERDIFLRLDTDAKREIFIEEFWNQRDPTPGTNENEYFDLHYERLAYATQFYGRDTPRPGWRTDMGRIHVLLGEPQDRTRLPNTSAAYPAEVWFYHADPRLGIPPFFYVVFFKERGIGEYRLYSPVSDGPDKLLNPSGLQQMHDLATRDPSGMGMMNSGFGETGAAYDVLQRVDSQLALAAISLIPGDGGMAIGLSPLRSEMMLAGIHNIPNKIMPNNAWAVKVLGGWTESEVRFETLPIVADAVVLMDPSGKPFVNYLFSTVGNRLNLRSYEDKYYMTFEVTTSLMDGQQRVLNNADPKLLEADLDEEDARKLRQGEIAYFDRIPTIPGRSKFDLTVENNVSREFGRAQFELDVPGPAPQFVGMGKVLLCHDSLWLSEEYDPYAEHFPFQLGNIVLFPSIRNVFEDGGRITVFHQLSVPQGQQDPLQVDYVITDNDGEVLVEKIVLLQPDEADDFGVINQETIIDLNGLTPGSYGISIDLQQDSNAAQEMSFEVIPPENIERPFVHAQRQPPPTDPSIILERAEQYRISGDFDIAIEDLQEVLSRDPELAEALLLQVELLKDAGRNAELVELVTPKLINTPNDLDLLLVLAEANANLAKHYDSIRYYERARISGQDDSPELLNALAAEYFADGNLAKARALLQQSLTLNEHQPEVRRLLDDVLGNAEI